jgi:hypothetical protein
VEETKVLGDKINIEKADTSCLVHTSDQHKHSNQVWFQLLRMDDEDLGKKDYRVSQ